LVDSAGLVTSTEKHYWRNSNWYLFFRICINDKAVSWQTEYHQASGSCRRWSTEKKAWHIPSKEIPWLGA